MGYPKQPGQDAEAHRRLAERHVELLQERDKLQDSWKANAHELGDQIADLTERLRVAETTIQSLRGALGET